MRSTLRAILQDVVRDELITSNPCDDPQSPSIDTEEKEPLTPEKAAEFRALLDAAKPRPTLVAFRLMLFASLRRGEARAVRGSDFDEAKGEITVSRSLCTETLEFKDTKTKAGRRTIPLDADTISYLKKFRSIQAEKALGMGKSLRDACICAKVGTAHIHPENLGQSLRRFGRAN